MVGEVKGKLTNGVGSQYSSHYLVTWCIEHYYRWCAHLGFRQSTELTPPSRFKWTRPFRRKTKSGLCACAITFQTQSSNNSVGSSGVGRAIPGSPCYREGTLVTFGGF